MTDELENDLTQNKIGSFSRPLNNWQENSKPSCAIHNADSTSCDSETEILERWREHFETALNHPT